MASPPASAAASQDGDLRDGRSTPFDVEMIKYLVSKGVDVKVVNREGKTTADMANGPVQRINPWPEALALLETLGAKNNHKCVSC